MFRRIFFIGAIFMSLSFSGAMVFGAEVKETSPGKIMSEGGVNKWASSTGLTRAIEVRKTPIQDSSGSTDTTVIEPTTKNTEEEKKLKQDINSYIIESYKVQGNKIINDLSLNLSRKIPNPDERSLAYEKIQVSLESRIKRTESLNMSESKKEVLTGFLEHLIYLLDKKIEELR
jgi:hypothetical protein